MPEARFRLAERMFTGSGIEQDPEAAYDLALKVAEEADLPEAWALPCLRRGHSWASCTERVFQ